MSQVIPELKGIARELRSLGLDVKVVPGWKDRGDAWSDRQGVIEHHTASPEGSGAHPALGIIVNGRGTPGTPTFLPGPLANFSIARTGTVIIVAAGSANHAGIGGPHQGIPANAANERTFGIEIENNGVGEDYSPEVMNATIVLTAVLLRRLDTTPRMAFGHKEWTSRKIDPSFDMEKFRRHVRNTLRTVKRLWRRSG